MTWLLATFQVERRLLSLRHVHLGLVLDLVIEHGIVGLLRVTHQLVNVLVDLNGRRDGAISILELNVVLARLFSSCLNLNGIA